MVLPPLDLAILPHLEKPGSLPEYYIHEPSEQLPFCKVKIVKKTFASYVTVHIYSIQTKGIQHKSMVKLALK